MIDIQGWIGAGKPPLGSRELFTMSSCRCDATKEHQASPADVAGWFNVCPGCRAQYEATKGVAYSASLGGFTGAGVTAPDARVLSYAPPPVISPNIPAPSSAPVTSPSQSFAREEPMTGRNTLAPVPPSQDFLGGLLGGIGGFITGGPIGAVAGAIGGYTGTGSGESRSSPGTQPTGYGGASLTSGCGAGYVWRNGRCEREGITGAIERLVPGGSTGVQPYTETQMGMYGVHGVVPEVRQQTSLKCGRGYVLGRDNLCYPKRLLPKSARKWDPGTKPLLTGGEIKTLRKINSLENKVKKAWIAAGKPGQRALPRKCSTRKR